MRAYAQHVSPVALTTQTQGSGIRSRHQHWHSIYNHIRARCVDGADSASYTIGIAHGNSANLMDGCPNIIHKSLSEGVHVVCIAFQWGAALQHACLVRKCDMFSAVHAAVDNINLVRVCRGAAKTLALRCYIYSI